LLPNIKAQKKCGGGGREKKKTTERLGFFSYSSLLPKSLISGGYLPGMKRKRAAQLSFLEKKEHPTPPLTPSLPPSLLWVSCFPVKFLHLVT
jgi:hypothetical protein